MTWKIKPLAKSQSTLVGIDMDQTITSCVTRQCSYVLFCGTHIGHIHDK